MKTLIVCMAAVFIIGGGGLGTAADPDFGDPDGALTADKLQEDPDQYQGATVVIAGTIDEVSADGDEIRLRLLPQPFDDLDPREEGSPSACFIAAGAATVDPRRLHRGAQVTVVGVVEGADNQGSGCPLIRIAQLDLLERPGWEGKLAAGLPRPWPVPYPWYYHQPSYPYPLFNPNHPPAYPPDHHLLGVLSSDLLPFIFLRQVGGQ